MHPTEATSLLRLAQNAPESDLVDSHIEFLLSDVGGNSHLFPPIILLHYRIDVFSNHNDIQSFTIYVLIGNGTEIANRTRPWLTQDNLSLSSLHYLPKVSWKEESIARDIQEMPFLQERSARPFIYLQQ